MSERGSNLHKFLNLTLIFAFSAGSAACGHRRPMVNPDGSALTTEQAEAWADPNIANPTPLPTNTGIPPGATESTGQQDAGKFGSVAPPDFAQHAGDPNYIRNLMTQAYFRLHQDPKNLGRQCVQLETYWEGNADFPNGNKQDVVGAAVALGPDTGNYKDIPGPISVYDPNNNLIGTFTTDKLPDHDTFGVVFPGTTVCDSSNVLIPEEDS